MHQEGCRADGLAVDCPRDQDRQLVTALTVCEGVAGDRGIVAPSHQGAVEVRGPVAGLLPGVGAVLLDVLVEFDALAYAVAARVVALLLVRGEADHAIGIGLLLAVGGLELGVRGVGVGLRDDHVGNEVPVAGPERHGVEGDVLVPGTVRGEGGEPDLGTMPLVR